MIRQGLRDLIDFGIVDTWDELSDEDVQILDELMTNVTLMEPLSKEEAMFLAYNLGRGYLEEGGNALISSIASAPFWPSLAEDIFYVNKFADPLTEFKRETMMAGNLRYYFTSEANRGLSFSYDDASIMLLRVQKRNQ